MKFYEANNELAGTLQKHGFIETTSEINKKKGKKSFKLSKSAPKEIYFDYINIRILNGAHGQDDRYKMTETELRSLLFYFKLNTTDFKTEINSSGNFSFKEVPLRIISLKKELADLIRFNLHKPRQNKIKRIIESYNNIVID